MELIIGCAQRGRNNESPHVRATVRDFKQRNARRMANPATQTPEAMESTHAIQKPMGKKRTRG
eukprot:6821694-Lingulodinium_polyedra.AAC.1